MCVLLLLLLLFFFTSKDVINVSPAGKKKLCLSQPMMVIWSPSVDCHILVCFDGFREHLSASQIKDQLNTSLENQQTTQGWI